MRRANRRAGLCGFVPHAAVLAAAAAAVAAAASLASAGCAPPPLRPFPDRPLLQVDDDQRPLARAPQPWHRGPAAQVIAHQLAEPLDRWLRGGDAGEARNVNAHGEVPRSSWFTPRPRHRSLPAEALRRGAARTPGPSLLGAWTVARAGQDDAGPFVIFTDEDRRRFVLRFDAPGHPRLATTASLVSTLVLHALGFHVPERHLVIFAPSQLKLAPKARWVRGVFRLGRKTRPLRPEDLARLLRRLPRLEDGSLRAVATRQDGAQDLGPFRWRGTRPGDPNDFVPHERRRELRGLRPVAAFLNLTGVTEEVPRDLFDPSPARRFVRHTLWELRGSLGSTRAGTPKPQWEGFTNLVSLKRVLAEVVTLGGLRDRWALYGRNRAYQLRRWPGLGWLPRGLFLAEDWAPRLENEAFARATDADLAWGARLLAALPPAALRTIVAEAYLPKAEADRLLRILVDRRRAVLRAWLDARAPFDHVTLAGPAGAQTLCVTDLWRIEALPPAAPDAYEVRWRRAPAFLPEPSADVPAASPRLCLLLPAVPNAPEYRVLELRRSDVSTHWLRVHLRARTGGWHLAGIER